MKTLHHLFNDILERAEMLTYVHGFNLSNSQMELDFILGQKDKDQWKVSRFFHNDFNRDLFHKDLHFCFFCFHLFIDLSLRIKCNYSVRK